MKKRQGKRPETSIGKVRDTKVSEVMSKDLVTVTEKTTIKELHKLFKKHDFNAFPVTKGDTLIGVVTKLDLLRIVSTGINFSLSRYWGSFATEVGDIMHRAMITLKPDDRIEIAAGYMVEYGLRSIPVVDGKRLVGIVSRDDLMEHLILNNDDL